MGMLRKAGVWLGVVEEEDEFDPREHGRDAAYLDDEIDDFVPTPPRPLAGRPPRVAERPREHHDPFEEGSTTAARAPRADRPGRPTPPPARVMPAPPPARRAPAAPVPVPPVPVPPVPVPPVPAAPVSAAPIPVAPIPVAPVSGPPAAAAARATAPTPAAPRPWERGDEVDLDELLDPPPPTPVPPARGRATGRRAADGTIPFPARESLQLAPAVQIREKAVAGDDQAQPYQITTLAPTSFAQARDIGEHFRDGNPVIMNLTEVAEADAKRLVDFAAGLAFGLRGSMERITNRVFLLSPSNVQVSAEDKQRFGQPGVPDPR